MKEYKDAKRVLDAAYRAAKQELAKKVQPIFFEQFKGFFVEYPEIAYIKFELSSSIYDDENYHAGINLLDFGLSKEFTTPEFRDIEEDYQWEDLSWEMEDTEGDVHKSLLNTFSSEERILEVSKAVYRLCDKINDMDADFLQNTFADNCVVRITSSGFEVEQ